MYHTAVAFFAYARWATIGSAAFAAGVVGHALLAAVGLWCILFASSSGRISRKTGLDKRTSGYPFNNANAHKTAKKELKKGM